MKWQPLVQNIPNLPSSQYDYEFSDFDEDTPVNLCRNALLRQSLDLVRDEPQNEQVVHEIVRKSLEAGEHGLVIEALKMFSPNSNYFLCLSIAETFHPKHWLYFWEDIAISCEKNLLQIHECRSTFYLGDHCPDQRSSALGYLGLYFLTCGNQQKAFHLWQAADDAYDVDEAIADVAIALVLANSEQFETAMMLVNLINTKTVKAQALASLSDFS